MAGDALNKWWDREQCSNNSMLNVTKFGPLELGATAASITLSILGIIFNLIMLMLIVASLKRATARCSAMALALNLGISNIVGDLGDLFSDGTTLYSLAFTGDHCSRRWDIINLVSDVAITVSAICPGVAHILIATFYYLATQKPFLYRKISTVRNRAVAFSVSWLLCLVFAVIHLTLFVLARPVGYFLCLFAFSVVIIGCVGLWLAVLRSSKARIHPHVFGSPVSYHSPFSMFILVFTPLYALVTLPIVGEILAELIKPSIGNASMGFMKWSSLLKIPFYLRLAVEPCGYIYTDKKLYSQLSQWLSCIVGTGTKTELTGKENRYGAV